MNGSTSKKAYPFTPPPSAIDASKRSMKHTKMILHSQTNNNKLSSLLFSNGKVKLKRKWNYLKEFPELSVHSISNSRSNKHKYTLKSPPIPNVTPTPKKKALLVITPFSEDESEMSSSSFTAYPITYTPTVNTHKTTHSKTTNYNTKFGNDVLNDSTDYDLSDSDEISSKDGDYPWPIDSDDSFAELSEFEVLKKLAEKLAPMQNLKIATKTAEQKEESKTTDTKTDSAVNQNGHSEMEHKHQSENTNSTEIDPRWYDSKNGKYLSFIVHASPMSNESEDISFDGNTGIGFMEYDASNDGDNEDEHDLDAINTNLFVPMPLQSACTPVDSDGFVCNITDIDE